MPRTFTLISSSVNVAGKRCSAETPIMAAKKIAEKLFENRRCKRITLCIKNKDKMYHYVANKTKSDRKISINRTQRGGIPAWEYKHPGSDKTYNISSLPFAIHRLYFLIHMNLPQPVSDQTWEPYHEFERKNINDARNFQNLTDSEKKQFYDNLITLHNQTNNLEINHNEHRDELFDEDKDIISSFLAHYAEQFADPVPDGPE